MRLASSFKSHTIFFKSSCAFRWSPILSILRICARHVRITFPLHAGLAGDLLIKNSNKKFKKETKQTKKPQGWFIHFKQKDFLLTHHNEKQKTSKKRNNKTTSIVMLI